VATVKTVLRPTHQTTVALDAALLRREVELKSSPLSGDMTTTQLTRLCTPIRYNAGPLFASVAVETRCDWAHDEVLCHRSR
jgi:hypothetical protein